jgi:hypothetical protein
MDMKYYWLQERVRQKQFEVFGAQVKTTLAIIIQNTIQRNIIKICAQYNYTRLTS